jgi:predicted nucleic acid-binding protein
MEQFQYLIDSNAVIDYLGNKFPEEGMNFMNKVIDNVPIVSVITKIEVLGFEISAENYKLLSDFMSDAIVLDLSDNVVDECINLRKKNKVRIPDAIIAATAIVNNFVLISRNVSDFKKISGLKMINPFDTDTIG